MIGWCIADLISKRIHRGWDSSAARREVFDRLTKTTRERSRISFPSWFIEAEIRPLVEKKSLFSWRRRPDRQTDRQRTRARDLRHSWRETARYSTDFFSKRIHRSWDSSTGEREVFVRLTKTTRQTDRQTDRQRTRDRDLRHSWRETATARISFPSGFIEAEIRPLVEEKSLFAWRRRPDRQTENQRERFETILKRDSRVQRIPKEPAAAARGGGESRFLVAMMTMEAVAELLGIGVPLLRFLVCFLASIPCSWLWRYVPSAAARHLYAAATGALLSYFSFGAASNVYFGILMLVSYASMLFSRRHCGIITFVIAFAFLITW